MSCLLPVVRRYAGSKLLGLNDSSFRLIPFPVLPSALILLPSPSSPIGAEGSIGWNLRRRPLLVFLHMTNVERRPFVQGEMGCSMRWDYAMTGNKRFRPVLPINYLSTRLFTGRVLSTHAPRLSLERVMRIMGAFFYCADLSRRAGVQV